MNYKREKKMLIVGFIILIIIIILYFVDMSNKNEVITHNLLDDNNYSEDGLNILADGNNKFAFDLYNELNKEQGNIFYSPYSISTALAITYEGSSEKTLDEMSYVLHFPSPDILAPNFAYINNVLNTNDKNYQLESVNALWLQKDFNILDSYSSRMKNYYNAKIENLDFANDNQASSETINDYIEDKTRGKIKNLIPSGSLSRSTKLVLTNAIYFEADWDKEFSKSKTLNKTFYINSSENVDVPMMYMKTKDDEKFNYANLDKLQILELPYKGGKNSMFILLPKQKKEYDYKTGNDIVFDYNLNDIELSYEKFKEYKEEMKETKLDSISIPKFEFDSKYFLKDILSEMGMPSAFLDANFSKINDKKDLYIDEVIHQAFVSVDEEGTEAAAATAVIMKEMIAMPGEYFNANHPFVFIILNNETNNILFLGKMENPLLK